MSVKKVVIYGVQPDAKIAIELQPPKRGRTYALEEQNQLW